MVGDVTIPSGETLTIDPGVEVKFDGDYSIYINGTLMAIGTEANKINITSNMAIPSPGDWGRIHINSTGQAEIQYCNISYGGYGVSSYSSLNNNIKYNNIFLNNILGIYLLSSSNHTITNNNISNNGHGIRMDFSSNNTITNNYIALNDWDGISLYQSSHNNITGNSFVNDGVFIYGDKLSHYDSHNISDDNIVNDKPLYYYKDSSGIGIEGSEVGQLILVNCSNVDVKDIQVNDTDVGLEFVYCTNIRIKNTIISNNRYGMYFANSSYVTITGCNVTNNYDGIYVYSSSHYNVTINNLSWNKFDGIYVSFSSNTNITNNEMYNNGRGVVLASSSIDNNIKSNNIHLNNFESIYLSSSSNNTIVNNEASSNKGHGFRLYSSSRNNITNNVIFLNKLNGLHIESSSNNNIITGNNISYSDRGIMLSSSNNNTIAGNNISNNDNGLNCGTSSNNTMINNLISFNNWEGIRFYSSLNNNIINNTVNSNTNIGIYIWISSNDNIIRNNNVSNNGLGIHLQSSSNNRIYHNNIINNTDQAIDDRADNYWDNGYPSGGNYWSDYGGEDLLKGPNQDIPGSDGIGDTHYIIDGNSHDNYPLMEPYKPLENYLILKQGWNLISIPLIQYEQNLTRVLGSIDGWYDAVQWYDNADLSDPWKHNRSGKPFGNDLSKINETMGFWIHIINPGDTIFIYNGTKPTVNQTISIHTGWNLVGYPSLTNHNRTNGLNNLTFGTHVDAIWTYNASTQKWEKLGPSDYFELGRGYWVHAKVECEWEVPL